MPHLTADTTAVDLGAWEYERAAGEWSDLGTHVPDWDYNTSLLLRRSVRVKASLFESQTRVAAGTPLRWSVVWRSVDTYVSEAVTPVDVDGVDTQTLTVELPGNRVSGRLDLYCRVVLGAMHDGPVGSAREPGSVLFEDKRSLALVGDAARFPVAVIDFEAVGLDPDASYVVDIPEELETPVHGGLLLLVNQRDHALVAAIERRNPGRAPDPLLQQLEEDTAVTILSHAAEHAGELSATQEDGTVGGALRELARQVPGGLNRLADLRSESIARFHATLVGEVRRLGLGRGLS